MHELKLFNSLGMEKETFVPLVPGKVSIYCCGPTVYNDPHIGNFRPVIVFDVLRRLLMHLGYEVTFVSNYTDVDDKIINRAKELGISEKELTTSVISEYRNLVTEVGSLQPDYTPTPTVYMPQIISYVQDLVDNGTAYAVDGDVYLSVKDIPGYGELSGNSVENLENGARIAVGDKKKDPVDFALWKKTEEGIKWSTPWSEGRPGWHTECCVMIRSIFSEQKGYIDIHGGGFDLKFPHHENEMAQAKAHDGHQLAHFWVHNGFININNEKMSKSLGNVVLMKDVVKEYGGIPFRLMLLASHYRAPAAFSAETIKEAQTKYQQILTAMKKVAVILERKDIDINSLVPSEENAFLDALCDDLNTPNALTVLYEEMKKLNSLWRIRDINYELLKDSFAKVKTYCDVLGLTLELPQLTLEDKELFNSYDEAKANKDFAKSDEIRQILLEKNLF